MRRIQLFSGSGLMKYGLSKQEARDLLNSYKQ